MNAGSQQVVLSAPAVVGGGGGKSIWLDERVFPAYAAAASLLVLALHAVWNSKAVRKIRGVDATTEGETRCAGFVNSVGGTTIFLFKIARLLGTLALFFLSILGVARNGWEWVEVATMATLTYCTVLALLNTLSSARNGLIISGHLSLVTFAVLLVYGYRDVWPLMTFTLQPKDRAEGSLLWAKVALATFVGALEPMFEPYPYIPYDPAHPMAVPNAEQTASLFSFLTYIWLEPTIWRAYRLPHLPANELPPLGDYDEMKNLIKHSYPNLDPFSGAKNGALFWGMIKIFRRSLTYQAILLVIFCLGRIAVPIGTNQLLTYLGNKGGNSFVKPWVWIVVLGGGPLVQSICWNLYVFFSTGTLARIEAIVTSLVFDHALRIRFKAETAEDSEDKDKDKDNAVATPASPAGRDGQSTSTPDNASDDDETVHSRTATAASTATSSTATAAPAAPAAASAKGKDGKQSDDDSAAAKKALKKGSNLVGKINNLVTSDLDSVTRGRNFLFILVSAPFMVVLSMWFLYQVLGWSAFVGLAVMIVLMPLPAWVASTMNGVQKQKMKSTDERVQSVTEVMGVLRMVKLFGWERKVEGLVHEKRENELKWLWRRKVLGLINNCLNYIIPLAHMVVTYAVYTLVMKKDLTAAIVFSSMSAFDMLRGEMWMMMYFIPAAINANVSLGRLADFLRNTELLDAFAESSAEDIATDLSIDHSTEIGFGRANFSWANEKNDGTVTPSRQTFRLRIDDEVKFKPGAFNLIIGPTGSGKTSVLMALLGEMHYIPLGPDSWVNLPRAGGVAYAAQESWVQSDTIKENILFGTPYDEERYKKVIYQCGLSRDLTLFDAGDATEVGEKGITLSGGQKARITLARAVYSPAKTLLLDDVLAALDVHTSRWIVDKCFKGDLIEGRTVLLVTHNVAMASPLANFVISLHDGHVVSQGSIKDALSRDKALAEEFEQDKEAIKMDENEEVEAAEPAELDTPAKTGDGKLVVAEEIAEGHVSWKAFGLFLSGLGGKWPLFFWLQYLLGSGGAEIVGVVGIWWLGYWAQQYTLHDSSDVHVMFYLGIYCALIGLVAFFKIYGQLLYTYATLRASRVIHSRLVQALLRTTFRWLDVTPTSRVIARCTQDIQSVDQQIPQELVGLMEITLTLVVKLGAIILFTPVFLLPAVFLAIFGGFLGNVYIKAQLSVKREMSNAKAPVLAVFGGAIAGLVSIRAYDAKESFRHQVQDRIDRYLRAALSFYNLNRWIGIRLDTLGQIFMASLAFYLVYGGITENASSVGFVISMASSFTEMIIWWVRYYNDFEVAGNSLERIQQYLDIDQEPEPTDAGKPPAYWPSSGELRVDGLAARYSLDGPKVLQDISFHAKAGERVGIVGRTGSGKSTLTLALLRCIYTEGTVFYDGIPTHSLNLDALRSNITIIPQVPELLSGTLRHNLDMFGQYDDATLNDALRAAGLFSLQRLSDENRIMLDTEIASGGGNLSVGQRQIIALARAIVRQSKLLILDEATSAIDYETDAVIQSSLRTELKSDVTVITVAHRLQTIMDYDKIMVLDAGRLVEYDTPATLLQKEGSLLRALVEESADKEALYAMAEAKHQA